MKKIVILFIFSGLLFACASYNTLDLSKLTTGMTKADVRAAVGTPYRVLAVNDTRDGYQEILEYRTRYDEVYALEFWNDYLTGVEFLYEDVVYTPPLTPPIIWPEYGRPIYIIPPAYNRPGSNNRPSRPSRPNPPTNNNNNSTSPSTRPPSTSRPSTGTSGSSRPSTTTPSTSSRPGSSTSRPSSSSGQ